MHVSRRFLLGSGLATGLASCATGARDLGSFASAVAPASGRFTHGVASGDPANDGFVIWTRVTPEDAGGQVGISWEIATDADFASIVTSGKGETGPARDWTFKEELTGLAPGGTYYYRFSVNGVSSPAGRAKTLPEGDVREARFAIVSCSNYPFGFFNVYDRIAREENFDAVIHLGDYFYEYGREGYGGQTGKKIGREHEPAAEIISLADYRTRHAQYKSDRSSQAMHAMHTLIPSWDDHETANNSWGEGAQNHQPDEGDWDTRRRNAMQAYYEWMPIREPKQGRARESLYSTYQWGKLLTMVSIETRLTARTEQLDYADYTGKIKGPEDVISFRENVLWAEDRYLMGDAQMAYLEAALAKSRQKETGWRVLANQVIMADVAAPDLTPYSDAPFVAEIEKELPQIREFIKFSALGLPLNLDAWDGYPAARERLYKMAKGQQVRDFVVLTGDTHECWANDLYTADGEKMGVELGTASVTSPGASSYFGDAAGDYSLLLRQKNRAVRYHNPANKGYIDLTLKEDKGKVSFVSVDTVLKPAYNSFVSASFDVVQRNGSLEFSNPSGLGFKERVLYGQT